MESDIRCEFKIFIMKLKGERRDGIKFYRDT